MAEDVSGLIELALSLRELAEPFAARINRALAAGEPPMEVEDTDLWKAADALEAAQKRIAKLEQMLRGCLLADPPGDCHAAEVVTLRARVKEREATIRALAAQLGPKEGPDPAVIEAQLLEKDSE